MAVDKVKKFFESLGEVQKVVEFEESTATSAQAAQVLGCEVGRIAKTISVFVDKKPILVLMSGDKKIDNQKFRAKFNCRPHMIPIDEVENLIGHAVGGVCPFAVNDDVPIYLDESLRRFEFIYPAAGSSNSVVKLTLDELPRYINFVEWIDVSKLNF